MKIGPLLPGQTPTNRPVDSERSHATAERAALQATAAPGLGSARPVGARAHPCRRELVESRILALALPATQWPLIIGDRISDILARGDA